MDRSTNTPGPVVRYYAFEATQAASFTLPIFVVYFQSRGLTLAAVGLLEAAYTVVSLVAEAPTGYVGDRLGHRRALLASAALAGAGAVGFALAGSLAAFLVVIVVRALAGALRSGTAEAWLYELLNAGDRAGEFARISGRAGAVGRISQGGAVVAGGALYALDPVAPWLVGGGVVAAGGLLALSLPRAGASREPPADGTADHAGGSARGTTPAGSDDGDDRPGDDAVPVGEAFRTAAGTLARPGLRRFVLYTAVVSAATAGAFVLVQPASRAAGVPVGLLGALYAVLLATGAVAASATGRVRERVGLRRWFALAPPAAGAVALSSVLVPAAAVAAFVATWALGAVSTPLANQYLNDRSGSVARATVLSGAAMVRGLLVAPAKFAAGVVAGAFSPAVAVAGVGAVLVVGAVGVAAVGGPVAATGVLDAPG